MSVREDLKIQADDITIVQGEKPKDYNVILTSLDDAPLSGVPVTIAFYNNDYTFERTATTNEFGVASVPIYLTGDSWFVDVHFKGDENYKPQVITKEINIEKFERLSTKIVSYNLNISEDYMGYGYTIELYDEYDNELVNEIIRIIIKQTGVDNPQTYFDLLMKTDEYGRISVPFFSYDENVEITATYNGSARYKPTINADLVSFEDIDERTPVDFRLVESANDVKEIQVKIGNSNWTPLNEELIFNLGMMITINEDGTNNVYSEPLDDFRSFMQIYDYYNYKFYLKDGDYTIGISNVWFKRDYYFCFKMFSFTQNNDNRRNVSQYRITQTSTSTVVGDLNHMVCNYTAYVREPTGYIGVGATGTNTTLADLRTNSDYVIKFSASAKHIIEFDSIVPSNGRYDILFDSPFIEKVAVRPVTIEVTSSSKDDATISQTGFGSQGQTYQDMQVLVSNNSADIHEKINDYYIMRLLNTETNEEFYFYSYLIDNVTASHIQYLLATGTWECYIVSKATDDYNGAYYVTTATLDIDSTINPPTSTIIAQAENYINLGTDTPTFVDDTITTATTDDDIHSIMALEFTNTNYYVLSFNEIITGNNPTIIIGADPTLETLDGLFISPQKATLYNDGTIIDELIFAESPFKQAPLLNKVRIQRNGNTVAINIDENIIYKTDLIRWNTFGIYQDETDNEILLSNFQLEPYVVTDITPIVSEYDGTVFGSNWHLELREDHLNFVDYGMLPQGAVGGGLVLLNDVPLPKDIDWDLEIGITYNNARYDRLNKLTGEIQARLYEDVSTSESTLEYSELLCSPTPVPNAKTVFTRKSDEGTLYYVKPLYQISDELGKVMQKPQYMCNPYIQYKGGVECYTETGISLFSLENQYSPVLIGNDLVRAEFHRRSGYIVISRYDDATDSWYSANILKLSENLKLQLNEYNDDYAKVSFGGTTWEFYRGRPFIVVKHPNVDIRILKLVDRVYCETINNEQSMGFIEEHNTMMSTFAPQTSIQKFKQEMHIGENIRADNFELYDVASNGNLIPLEHNASIYTTVIDNDNALAVDKHFSGKLALNFPSSSQYLKKPSNQFSLYIGNIDVGNETSITIKARGFDENGAIHLDNNLQYGIWESSQTFTVNSGTTEIRATFDCIDKVKYIDFVIIFNTNAQSTIIMNKLMCHDGDSEPNWNVDTSIRNANKVQITFDETYYANLYNEDSPVGLCIIRPNQNPLTLRNISASDETVLAPYMKSCNEWDKPQQIFLEYLNANRQIIDIDWEEF